MNKNTFFIIMLLLIGLMALRSGISRDGFSLYMWTLAMYIVARIMTADDKKKEERS